MKYLLLLLLAALFSCRSGSSGKGQEKETDSIRLQKELSGLEHYIDSVFENDSLLQRRFHCRGAGLGEDKVFVDFEAVPEDSFNILVGLFKKEVADSPLLEFSNVEYITDGPLFHPSLKTEGDMNPDSLSMKTEYDYYPLSTTEVKVIITNHSRMEYEGGEDYNLDYYNESKQQWEPLPVPPIVNDVLWLLPPEHSPYEQTIEFYTRQVPNRPGKYRITKAFSGKAAYAEFEMVDKKGVERLRKRIDDCWLKNKNCITAENIIMTYTQDGDTIFVVLINNAPRFQEMLRREIVNYSAINCGKVRQPAPFLHSAFLDTLQISMKTEKAVYPIGAKSVKVTLTNNNTQSLFFGKRYTVARKEGKQWIILNSNSYCDDIGIIMEQGQTHQFTADLYPLFNDNKPGIYRVYKEIEFYDSSEKWYMAAEFKIE